MYAEITIIIPCFNRQDFLPRLFRSLNDQVMDKNNFKVIVVDDGSKQPISINHNEYEFKITLLMHKKNLGLPAALNTALKEVNTRFFVRIDSDDYVHKLFLTVLRLKFELDSNSMAASVDYIKVNQTEQLIGIFSSETNPIGCGIMFKTEIIKIVGNYDEKMLLAEEIEFRNRVQKLYKIHNIALPLYRYVQHDENITNDIEKYNYFKKKLNE